MGLYNSNPFILTIKDDLTFFAFVVKEELKTIPTHPNLDSLGIPGVTHNYVRQCTPRCGTLP